MGGSLTGYVTITWVNKLNAKLINNLENQN
jgi:hypothetical protein